MKDISFLNIMHTMKISFSTPFSFEIADFAKNIRPQGQEKQVMVSCSWPKKGNKSPVAGKRNTQYVTGSKG